MYGFSFNNIFLGQIILTETGLQIQKQKQNKKNGCKTWTGVVIGWKIMQMEKMLSSLLYPRLQAVSLFFCGPSGKTRDMKMATHVTDVIVLSLNLKKKRDYSQIYSKEGKREMEGYA